MENILKRKIPSLIVFLSSAVELLVHSNFLLTIIDRMGYDFANILISMAFALHWVGGIALCSHSTC